MSIAHIFTAAWQAEIQKELTELVWQWADINSSWDNPRGLELLAKRLEQVWQPLADEYTRVEMAPRLQLDMQGRQQQAPVSQALVFTKRPQASYRLLLVGHMDTVFGLSSPFQRCHLADAGRLLVGPGVTDMKGGLAIMYAAMRSVEAALADFSPDFGWQVIVNTDEEIGSPSSANLLMDSAQQSQVGLVFEPAFPDGALVSSRKSSANLAVVAQGRSAHVGRNFSEGRNAIVALAKFICELEAMLAKGWQDTVTLNVGTINGGSTANVVAERALCQINLRAATLASVHKLYQEMEQMISEHNSHSDITLKLYKLHMRAHKPFDEPAQQLFALSQRCALELGLDPLDCRPTGGVCDGNILAGAGLATLDTLGAVGGKIHTEEEYLLLESLPKRSALVAQIIYKLSSEKPCWTSKSSS